MLPKYMYFVDEITFRFLASVIPDNKRFENVHLAEQGIRNIVIGFNAICTRYGK